MQQRSLAVTLALLLFAVPCLAQRPDTLLAPTPDPTPRMFAGGLIGALVGGLAGAVVGIGLETSMADPCSEWCGLAGGAGGFLVGETLGLSAGVHLGNRSRGSFALTALTAGAVFLVGARFGESLPTAALVIAVPTIQLITAASVQKATSR